MWCWFFEGFDSWYLDLKRSFADGGIFGWNDGGSYGQRDGQTEGRVETEV